MTAAAVLTHLNAAGIRLEVRAGALLATPKESLTDDARSLIRANKPALLELLSRPAADAAHRLWLVTHPDGRRVSHSFTPPASRREVEAWYPGALVEPEADPHEGQTTAGAP
ncbi:hypothetical protein [uncultured Lamprocystis sp.]|jgi:hypothetical protein|uniref:TubC N-terminal docking domain-related protein n=1 Tax=uncultured Lamprocystis sp. TaxID=543132 RepID=UPI0025CDBFE1|nr:hypothetical protein [uncultured Lamprocystis sp.]